MSEWKTILAQLASDADAQFDQYRARLKRRLGLDDPLMIQPYIGYGTPHRLHLKGRVLEDEGITLAGDNDRVWHNLLNAYRQLESDEIPGAVVRATLAGQSQELVTDREGFFDLDWRLERPFPAPPRWLTIDLELAAAPVPIDHPIRAQGRILIPPPDARFGIISDIDDTVLQSDATAYLKAARLLFLHNARTRLPFAGVAAFYQALQGAVNNPIFYVSSSPWNLYRLLTDFFAFNDIPDGPLFLRDYGLSSGDLGRGHHGHKLTQINQILATYPKLPFVLIGDSGQQDPEIYAQVVRDQPGRVLAVYIRDVAAEARDRQVLALAAALRDDGVEMVLAEDTLVAARHAAGLGLIDPAALPLVERELLGLWAGGPGVNYPPAVGPAGDI